MREIKFRAWEDGKMYYQVRCGGVFDGIPTAPTVWNEIEGGWANLTGQPHTKVMQYTGLKDKNGKEIYEGDFIKHSYNSGFVEFGKHETDSLDFYGDIAYGFFVAGKENDNSLVNNEEYEVIGNIYENPIKEIDS